MDENARSTTPPLPPPDFTQSLLQQPQEPSQSESTNSEPQDQDKAAADDQIQDDEMEPEHQESEHLQSGSCSSKTIESVPGSRQSLQQPNGNENANGSAANPARARLTSPDGSDSPGGTPSSLPPFDWSDLESTFEKSLEDANAREKELMAEFGALVKYFNIWGSAASAHDNERATKRLQTRSHFVKLRENELESRRRNYEQVVQAFESAMLLLKQAHS
ncbi:hypothetical protein BD289DRAFT_441892 [Coniella lustricola]|uniref:Uncharacterized protein n=1 Tax=Coniella lustricola TaxID=2025994 RepID=A0A2T2ZYS9_9PEZI|nr:hypothetical protein BD289DRAFT_441892 [Coniella lustricola]